MRKAMLAMALLMVCASVEGCDADRIGGPEASRSRAGPAEITVMTWNVYVGAEIERVLGEPDPALIPVRVAEAWAAVQATDFRQRADVLADEIARVRPHLVGLQEVSLFRLQSPGDFLVGNPASATDVALDFLAVLEAALEARGLAYRLAATIENFDLEVPMAIGPEELVDIRLTDYDVILARADLATSNPRSGRYDAYLPVSLGGAELAIRRGWVSIDVVIKDRTYRFVNTHLEPADDHGTLLPELVPVQGAQAMELLALLNGFTGRTILVGDLNSAADGSTTSTYADLLEAGFIDTWLVGARRGDGFTANQDADLLNPESKLFHRIDYVLYRDDDRPRDGLFLGSVDARLVGVDPARRTTSGLWPSDHAGVAATLRVEQR